MKNVFTTKVQNHIEGPLEGCKGEDTQIILYCEEGINKEKNYKVNK